MVGVVSVGLGHCRSVIIFIYLSAHKPIFRIVETLSFLDSNHWITMSDPSSNPGAMSSKDEEMGHPEILAEARLKCGKPEDSKMSATELANFKRRRVSDDDELDEDDHLPISSLKKKQKPYPKKKQIDSKKPILLLNDQTVDISGAPPVAHQRGSSPAPSTAPTPTVAPAPAVAPALAGSSHKGFSTEDQDLSAMSREQLEEALRKSRHSAKVQRGKFEKTDAFAHNTGCLLNCLAGAVMASADSGKILTAFYEDGRDVFTQNGRNNNEVDPIAQDVFGAWMVKIFGVSIHQMEDDWVTNHPSEVDTAKYWKKRARYLGKKKGTKQGGSKGGEGSSKGGD